MKRLLPGLLLLLGIVVQSADADYIIIRADFGGVQVPPKGGGPAVGTQPMGQTADVHATALVEVSKRFTSRRLVDYANTRLSVNTYLFGDDKSIFLYKGPNKNYFTGANGLPTVTSDLKAKKDALKAPTAIQRLELAEWVLARGLSVSFLEKDENTPALPQTMLGEFREQMDELKKQGDGGDPKVKAALDAYEQVHQKMHIPLLPDDVLVNEWKDKLGCQAANPERHYTLLFKGAQSPPQELLTRIIGLERVYEGFYYWFALKGKVLEKMPKNRLVVVVLENQREFRDRQATFDAGPLVVDGFLARREQLAIYFNEPLDDGYQALAKSNQSLLWAQGWNRSQLLRGIRPKDKDKVNPNEVDRAQTLALLQRAMEEEGDLLAGTHIGVEQLIAVSGLLPRTVPAPQWIQFGIPSTFAASRGALWAGFGGANWEYLLEFKRHYGNLEPAVALRHVLSDHYFNAAITEADKPAALRKARCLAWSLSHYLAHRELDGLLQYYKELATLPRELELDEGALLGCFARAFKLEQAGMPGTIDEVKLKRMAEQWIQVISRTVQDKVQDPDLNRIRSELKLHP